MLLTAILPYFGGKRTMAPAIVRQLGPHQLYFEGCFGSLAIVMAKPPSEHEQVCDLHGGATNLAWCLQDKIVAPELYERLQRVCYDDELYARSKAWLADFEKQEQPKFPFVDWAYHYFIASWMGRNGVAGTAAVNYLIATRWTKGGGSGPLRFRNATESIPAWHERLRNVHILRRDLFECLEKVEDNNGVSILVDPPYLPSTVSSNSKYLHDFTMEQHWRLAKILCGFSKARVVVCYYAAPLLKDLYPGWSIIDCSRHKHTSVQAKRGSKREDAPEVLLMNGEPFAEDDKPVTMWG